MLLEQLVEHHMAGMGFLATEALFNMSLQIENRLTFHKHGISFCGKKEPISGHTYPVMYFFGITTSVVGHPFIAMLHQNYEPLTTWGLFGLAFAGGAIAVEAAFGKLGYAPWSEVYRYIENRINHSFDKGMLSYAKPLKRIPATVAEKSSCLWLMPAWAAFATTCAYIHDLYFRCKH